MSLLCFPSFSLPQRWNVNLVPSNRSAYGFKFIQKRSNRELTLNFRWEEIFIHSICIRGERGSLEEIDLRRMIVLEV